MEQQQINAVDHQASDGSVVHSGLLLAEAIISAMNSGKHVTVSLVGLKGAASSYFNVMLRRLDEACGLTAYKEQVKVVFDSIVQEMMYKRSLDSLQRGLSRQHELITPKPDGETPAFKSVRTPNRWARFFPWCKTPN